MKGVVLAAGAGTRMWPLATAKPKHLLPIAGQPIISYTLKALAEAGINEVYMVVGFKADQIEAALGNGSQYGLEIEYVHQGKWTGTASALDVARSAMGDEQFVALYGDLLTTRAAIESVLEKGREGAKAMGVVRVRNQSAFGAVQIEQDRVTKIHEKPERKISGEGWINSGIYVLDPDVFGPIKKTSKSKRGEYELTTSLQQLIDEGEEVRAAAISREDWMDIGRPWDLLEANERILMNSTPQIKGLVESGATIKGPVWLESTAVVKSGCYVEGPAYIGRGSSVGPNSRVRPCTTIGDDVIIGTSCEIKNSIVMNETKIPHLSYIGDSIIGENCNVSAGTITANIRLDERPVTVELKGKRVDSGRRKLGTMMGDRVQTGINVSIMPGVRIGQSALIGPGVTVYDDVLENCVVFARQSLATRQTKRAHKK